MAHLSGTAPCILQIIPGLHGGGAEATTLEITRALTAAGGRSVVVSEGGGLEAALAEAGGELVKAPVASKNPVTMWRNIGLLARIADDCGADILHARSRAPAWSALWAAKRTGRPFLATYHGKVHDGPRLKVLYNSVMTRGARVIANSEFTAGRIREVHKISPDKLEIVPRGCDPGRFDPARQSAREIGKLRALWGARPEDWVILCPARLTRWKGQMVLLEAAAELPPAARLVLTGDTADKNGVESGFARDLKSRARETGLAERLVFAGHVANMPLAYAAADLAVLPSLDPEPFGRTAVEAQAAGLPVIASDSGGFRETVRVETGAGPGTGWRVPPGDVGALRDQLAEALDLGRGALSAIGEAGRLWARENFTTDKMCERTLQIYQSVIDEHEGG